MIEIVKMEMMKYLFYEFPEKYLEQISKKIRGENLQFEKNQQSCMAGDDQETKRC